MSGRSEDSSTVYPLQPDHVTFESLLEMAGDSGRWQWTMFFLVCLSGYFMAFQHLGSMFLAALPDHWCYVPDLPSNWTQEQVKAFTIPKEERDDHLLYSQCHYYVRNYSAVPSDFVPSGSNITLNQSSLQVAECSQWSYNRTQYQSTIAMQWDLVCAYKPLMSTVQGAYMGGMLLGALLCGPISDRFGRRTASLLGVTTFVTFSIALAFSTHIGVLIFLRMVVGISAPAIFSCPLVLLTELVSPGLRAGFGLWFEIPFGLGYATLPLLAYFIREWNYLQLSYSLPAVLMFSYFCFLPESPRWLITRGRYQEAAAILNRCAATNKKVLPTDQHLTEMMRNLKETEEKKNQEKNPHKTKARFLVLDLVATGEMRKRTLVVYFTWFVVALVYYGLALNAPTLASNPYLVVFLGGVLEIPAYILGNYFVNWFGRRYTYSGTFLIGGINCLLILVIPSTIVWIPAVLAVSGKFIITITFGVSYLYTAELFPTVVRNLAVSFGSMFARVGSISAPYIVYLLGHYHSTIPLVLFGCLALVAGLLSFLLPETNKKNLSETVKEVELNIIRSGAIEPEELITPINANSRKTSDN